MKSGSAFSEYASRIIEQMIFGNDSYLEDNTFSTGHQMVNVYRIPERYYEVRSDNSAIDVQIHEKQGGIVRLSNAGKAASICSIRNGETPERGSLGLNEWPARLAFSARGIRG